MVQKRGRSLSPLRADGADDVYPPSEDTHLLQDALSRDAAALARAAGPHAHILELGTGSGVVARHATDALRAHVTAVDVNRAAARRAAAEAADADVLRGDLVSWAAAHARFDAVVFNPPYVPTDRDEMRRAERCHDIAASWAGGHRGREVIDRALPVVRRVLDPAGLFYLVVEKVNDVEDVRALAAVSGFDRGVVVGSTAAGREQLFVLRFEAQEDKLSPEQ